MTTTDSDRPHHPARRAVKSVLGAATNVLDTTAARGATLLIYHRIGGATPDELDVAGRDFAQQIELLQDESVVSLDAAADAVAAGRTEHRVVITFDDGFRDVYHVAWPLLRAAQLPFTVYLASGYVDRVMRWPGSTAVGEPGHGLSWDQLRDMLESGLMTVANHTHDHVPPDELTADQLDRCADVVQTELGVTTEHFAYTWGIPVPRMTSALADRFRTAATGEVGRNDRSVDPMAWRRVPVRGSDPLSFFAAKLGGRLTGERTYAALASSVKQLTPSRRSRPSSRPTG